jgi:hypothetical protein
LLSQCLQDLQVRPSWGSTDTILQPPQLHNREADMTFVVHWLSTFATRG